MNSYETDTDLQNKLEDSITRLLGYCKRNNWSGYDPFDGLNSKIFASTPFRKSSLMRLVFIQAMKRSPINLRPIFLVPKEQNPKGLALFLSTLLKLQDLGFLDGTVLIDDIVKQLVKLRSPNSKFYCWGYHFDWQNRGFFLPKFMPNIICTTFAGNALIDFYERYQEKEYLDMAVSAGHFMLSGLNITRDNNDLCFSYTPVDRGQVHNANLLGASFLSRLYSIMGESEFLDCANQAVRFSVKRQQPDGSWPYSKTQRWIDNFHTGYNLGALKRFSEYTGSEDYLENIRKGLRFYKKNLFSCDGIPKYYSNKKYPIDIHALAQSIITLTEFREPNQENLYLAKQIFLWSLKKIQSKNSYYYYQKKRLYRNKIPYMRWSQAWMLYALTILLHGVRASEPPSLIAPV